MNTMAKTILDKAIEAVPKFGRRIKLFTEKMRIAQYADNSIYDYRLKISQAVLHYQKLPEQFTQDDIEGYLSMLLNRDRCSLMCRLCRKRGRRSHILKSVKRRVGRSESARTVIASVSSSGVSVLPRGLRHSLSCVRVTK